MGNNCLMGTEFLWGHKEKPQNLSCECTGSSWFVCFNMVHCILCKFYLNFKKVSRQQPRNSDFTVLGQGFLKAFQMFPKCSQD